MNSINELENKKKLIDNMKNISMFQNNQMKNFNNILIKDNDNLNTQDKLAQMKAKLRLLKEANLFNSKN